MKNPKISYVKLFARQGKVILCNSVELNELLKTQKDPKGDFVLVVPILFDTEAAQIREADADELKNLLPNTILTSPYKILMDDDYDTTNKRLFNTKPFIMKRLQKGALELMDLIRTKSLSGLLGL